jgi:hypothetical protein
MELFSNLSDDQIALLGCATALVSTGSLMCLSYFIGRGRMQGSRATSPERSATISGLAEGAAGEAAERSKRRSAA